MRNAASLAGSRSPIAGLLLLLAAQAAGQAPDVDALVARVAERVREFYRHAQTVVCTEKVILRPINTDLSPVGFARELEYDLRVEWETAGSDGDLPEARMTRELRKINGRAPRPKDEPGCTDPRATTPDPLAMLLPQHRDDYTFSWKGVGRFRDRPSIAVDYRLREPGPLEARWDKDCVSLSVPVRTKGRIWVDLATNDVMRLDESLASMYEYRLPREHARAARLYWQIRRMDSSVRYRPVTFHDPEETMLLPESIDSLILIEGAQSYRKTQTFSSYRRFLTGARMVR